ncbi:indolepyruvate oxidoreductase subunit beta family protein [Brucella tritici]|uniref:indolepyruvate oxidoreductase subunit beta family protein n=1 Tax=Brucella tritici TaxID=94626 RepID=UPI0015903399|nr:indolepyruvate oxidoreductase subunit beta family protein [Brucella tritici]
MNIEIAKGLSRFSSKRPISVAILAMGGQGGGVLADWIVQVAESQGWAAQSTSVPGVAQRTGATIYYIEMLPEQDGIRPIFSLMPTPGDVDVVLAAEFMEAGRAMLRGIVTPERTTLIASSHRSYAVVEKQTPGDGTGDPVAVIEAAGIAAKRIIAFDMQSLAEKSGSVVSAAMFGALASAEVLPFARSVFEDAIRAGGKGVEPSLRAFASAFDRAREDRRETISKTPAKHFASLPIATGHKALDNLVTRIRSSFPEQTQSMLFAGVSRLVDYQDPAYADEYLDRMEALHRSDGQNGGEQHDFAFTLEAAKYLAIALAYDDVIRVADLKTRTSRFDRVRKEVGVKADQIIYTTEYMHPRMEEVAGTMPASFGRFLETSPRLFRLLDKVINKGRRVRTGTVGWFLMLHLLAGARRFRRSTLRHQREFAHIESWLVVATGALSTNYDLAVEAVACRRLVKGYSDTHARGQSKFDKVIGQVSSLCGRPDGAAWLNRLRRAALLDEEGTALDGALLTVASLSENNNS